MRSKRMAFIIEIVILTSIAIALELVPFLQFTIWSTDTTVSFEMIPIFIAAFRWGLKGGLLTGFLCGIVQIIFDQVYFLNYGQALIEYCASYMAFGLAGFVSEQVIRAGQERNDQKMFLYVSLGVAIGGIANFIVLLATLLMFYADSIQDRLSVIQLIFNINKLYFLPPLFLSVVVITFLFSRHTRLLLRTSG